MIENLLTSNYSPLSPYSGDTVIAFLSKFSKPEVSGVIITPNHPDSVTSIEVLDFQGNANIRLANSSGENTPFAIRDGESFTVEAHLKLRTANQGMLFSNLLDYTGSSSVQLMLNNTYGSPAQFSFDIRHKVAPNADALRMSRYRFGLGKKLPVNKWCHVKLLCDGETLIGFLDGIGMTETYPWYGAVEQTGNNYHVGASVDGQYAINGYLDGFRFLKWQSGLAAPTTITTSI